jgi:CDP-glucose 4,6-dehydratase
VDPAILPHIKKINGPILITGHTGFKGTWLTILLEQIGIEVTGLSLQPVPESLYSRSSRLGKINEAFIDVRDSDAIFKFIDGHKPKIIIHLAAQPLVLDSYKDPKYSFDVNVNGTVNVLDAAFKVRSTEVVLVSTTDKVYENNGSNKSFTEKDPLKGKDPYSASKVAVENVVFAWREIKKLNGGPRLLTVRSGNVIGGGDFSKDRLIPDLIRSFTSNSEMQVRNPNSTRPWQHVLDPLFGYMNMIDNSLKGNDTEILNFGPNGKSLTVKEVVRIASDKWEYKNKIKFYSERGEIEAITLKLDSKKAKKVLNWTPRWSQKEAIIETINWWSDVLSKKCTANERCSYDINKLFHSAQ